MTWTLEHARQRAQQMLAASADPIEVAIIHSATQEFDAGWVFFHQSSRFLETKNPEDCLVGNAPLFVSRENGQAAFISYLRPYAESMDAYRACGNPNAYEQPQIRLRGWQPGAVAVEAIRLIRQHSSLGLADAKHVIDDCLASNDARVNTKDVAAARQLVIELAKAGFLATITYDDFGVAFPVTTDGP